MKTKKRVRLRSISDLPDPHLTWTLPGPGPELDNICSDNKERQLRHNTGWSNIFAFPWEVSAFWDFTTRLIEMLLVNETVS